MADERRNAKEWGRLIRAWDRSGLSAQAFAESKGVSPRTLTWWRWRLQHAPGSSARASERGPHRASARRLRRARVSRVGLIPVRVVERSDATATASEPVAPQPLAWEIVAPSGHAIRVYADDGAECLTAAIRALLRGAAR